MLNPALKTSAIEREIADLLLLYPELEEDEALRLDTIEGETGALEFLDKLLSGEREADAQSDAIKVRMDALKARKDAAERRKEGIRKLMFRLMNAASLRKVMLAEATLSVRAVPPSLVVTDEAVIPDQFWKEVRTLDRSSVLNELKAGHEVAGAQLSNGGETISVRTS